MSWPSVRRPYCWTYESNARGFWAAKKGRDALQVDWDTAKAVRTGSPELTARYLELAGTPGKVARKEGSGEAGLARAARVV